MPNFIAGRSLYENCGPYVIVAETTLEHLERSAPIVRDLLGRASRATTIAQMGALLDQLPIKWSPDWRSIGEDEFEITDVDQAPPLGLYRRCVESYFWSSASETYDSNLMCDTTACYYDMFPDDPTFRALIRPFIETARAEDDAGFEDLTAPIVALEEAGHHCRRDDDRIRHVFGHLMTDAYLRADEAQTDE